MITVVRAGGLSTVQDLGRPGYAHLGVPRSGALDVAAARVANALVGNPAPAAVIETTLMGVGLRFSSAALIAVTGASAVVKVDGVAVSGPSFLVAAGSVVDVGRAVDGVRSYVAVAGGIDLEPVLGSRSTDTLSGLGPAVLKKGTELAIGRAPSAIDSGVAAHTHLLAGAGLGPQTDRDLESQRGERSRGSEQLVLEVRLGPREGWFDTAELFAGAYVVSPVSNRVGVRLVGPALTRVVSGELPPEGVVLGAIQVPADGQPLIFLADHPTTGGYPVIGVVDDVGPLAQARPGAALRFRPI